MSNTQDPPVPSTSLARAAALTPEGSPIVLPGVVTQGTPPTLSAEGVQLLNAAYQAIPPGAIKSFLLQNKTLVVGLVIPLALTTYSNLKQIWEGPTAIAAVTKQSDSNRARIEVLEKKMEGLDGKLDKVLWIVSHNGPTSGPNF